MQAESSKCQAEESSIFLPWRKHVGIASLICIQRSFGTLLEYYIAFSVCSWSLEEK
jgi:hypothetical protein